MERIQFDIRHFLRSPDGKKMLTHPRVNVIKEEVLEEEVPSTAPVKSISMGVVFLIITLIVIAIVVFVYIYNKDHNSTKKIISQNVKENGKN